MEELDDDDDDDDDVDDDEHEDLKENQDSFELSQPVRNFFSFMTAPIVKFYYFLVTLFSFYLIILIFNNSIFCFKRSSIWLI